MNRQFIWMDDSVDAVFRPPVEQYTKLLLDRFIPLFDDVDGEQERASKAILTAGFWEEDDYLAITEEAYERGIEHALMFMEMRTLFLAISVAGLFHLFEKQVYRHLRREFRDSGLWKPKEEPFSIDNWSTAEKTLRSFDCSNNVSGKTLVDALDNPDFKELKYVANTAKHGEGRSAEDLRKMGAPVVDPGRIDRNWSTGKHSLLGLPLSIRPNDVLRYSNAILGFWGVRGRFYKSCIRFK